MAYTEAQRLSQVENRLRAVEAALARFAEAINQCVTLDQVTQLEVLAGTEMAALQAQVTELQAEIDLLRNQGFEIG